MLIGRSDDPQNPCRVAATKVTFPFGGGSRNPPWPAAAGRDTQAGHTTANRTASEFFSLTPCTQGAVHTRPTFAEPRRGYLVASGGSACGTPSQASLAAAGIAGAWTAGTRLTRDADAVRGIR
jgi:hypothetical protein